MILDYVAFLEGTGEDEKGRDITKVLAFSNWKLELIHNYIQCVFPTNSQSKFSKIRPVSDEELQILRNSDKAKENVRKMYHRMLKFWKLDGDRYLKWGLKGTFRFWNYWDNHNHWRMSRVLNSLCLLRMDEEFKDFSMRLSKMIELRNEHKGVRITKETAMVWKENMESGEKRENEGRLYNG